MSINNKIAEAIEEAYAKKAKKSTYKVERGINPINDMSMDTGIELAHLLSEFNTDNDPMTDWSMKIFNFECLIKDLLILIGRPGILETLHPSTREKASFQLMKLLDFFQSINNKHTTGDWLTWLMLDQFSADSDHDEADREAILSNLNIKC